MPLSPIPIERLTPRGLGLKRPEDVVVGRDGRVWASDQASACAEIRPDGSLRRVGRAGGAPNGINMDAAGRILIANFGIAEGAPGPLQRLDPDTGVLDTICEAIDGRTLLSSNYPIVDGQENIWCSHSTWSRDWMTAPEPDGFIYRVRPDGRAEVMAEGLSFANGLALDADESHLYVCQSFGLDVVRFPIRPDGSLGSRERYGPLLGGKAHADATREERATFGAPDGCGFDAEGNLWVTLVVANKIVAITPSGDMLTIVHDPDGERMRWPTNVSWGGPDLRDLYIGSIRRDYVLVTRSPVAGLPLIHQRADRPGSRT